MEHTRTRLEAWSDQHRGTVKRWSTKHGGQVIAVIRLDGVAMRYHYIRCTCGAIVTDEWQVREKIATTGRGKNWKRTCDSCRAQHRAADDAKARDRMRMRRAAQREFRNQQLRARGLPIPKPGRP